MLHFAILLIIVAVSLQCLLVGIAACYLLRRGAVTNMGDVA